MVFGLHYNKPTRCAAPGTTRPMEGGASTGVACTRAVWVVRAARGPGAAVPLWQVMSRRRHPGRQTPWSRRAAAECGGAVPVTLGGAAPSWMCTARPRRPEPWTQSRVLWSVSTDTGSWLAIPGRPSRSSISRTAYRFCCQAVLTCCQERGLSQHRAHARTQGPSVRRGTAGSAKVVDQHDHVLAYRTHQLAFFSLAVCNTIPPPLANYRRFQPDVPERYRRQ